MMKNMFISDGNKNSPPLSRDKADTLLLLATCLLIMLPHSVNVSWWINLCCACLLAWRAWLTLNGRRLPASWVLLPIAALTMLGVYLEQRTLFGRDAGVRMLILLLSCKLLEMHAKRDLFVVLFLCDFLLLTSFFYSQSMGSAVFSVVALAMLLTTQLSFQYTGAYPGLYQRFKLGASILGLAIPLTVVAFLLFPRIQGPLWSLPSDAHSSKSGLSDSMSPGNISDLALSDEIAFRVKFQGPVPNRSLMYWRGAVMNNFDGRTWTARKVIYKRFRKEAPSTHTGAAVTQDIILEPSGQNWLFSLDIAANPPVLGEDMDSELSDEMELRSTMPISKRLRYQVKSYPQYTLQANFNANELNYALQLPPGFNPKTLVFAKEARERYTNDEQYINYVLQYFRQEKFSYTLTPPILGTNSIDDFLFNTRDGFCEHYSSAFVVLMRAAGLPARVVAGYQGGTLNIIDGFMEVRQADAHAWAEVWLSGRGWTRFDPTAAVAPWRVNLPAERPRTGLAGLANLNKFSVIENMRMRWNALNNTWNQWVLNYNQESQRNLMSMLGLADLDWPQLALFFFAIASIIMAAIALPLMKNRPQISALDRVYLALCQKLARKGYSKALHEGPSAYALRLQIALSEQEFAPVQKFLALYTAAKYGKNHPDNPVPHNLLVIRLKKLLAQCR